MTPRHCIKNVYLDEEKGKGRHNIRKMIKDKNVADETKTAVAEERDRRKRIEERQAQYNKMFSLPDKTDKGLSQLVLDFDPDTKEVVVEVDKRLVSKLKPHQAIDLKNTRPTILQVMWIRILALGPDL